MVGDNKEMRVRGFNDAQQLHVSHMSTYTSLRVGVADEAEFREKMWNKTAMPLIEPGSTSSLR